MNILKSTIFEFWHAERGEKEIARSLMPYVLKVIESNKEITLIVLSENISAKKLYEYFGFKQCGFQRSSIFLDGKYIHEEQMDLLAEDLNS